MNIDLDDLEDRFSQLGPDEQLLVHPLVTALTVQPTFLMQAEALELLARTTKDPFLQVYAKSGAAFTRRLASLLESELERFSNDGHGRIIDADWTEVPPEPPVDEIVASDDTEMGDD